MLEIKKISRGFQVTLPRSFRERFQLNIGDLIEFIEDDGQLTVKPIKRLMKENSAQKLLSFLENAGDSISDMTEEEILELARQQKKL